MSSAEDPSPGKSPAVSREADGRLHSSIHIPVLDGVRGVAILFVLLFHFDQFGHGLPPPSVLLDKVVDTTLQAGWIGVDLFFVLSGFLITGILYDAKYSANYFRNFYIRRCLRIFPLYYLSLVIFLIILPKAYPSHAGLQSVVPSSPWYWTYLSNVWISYHHWGVFGVIDHFWSLAVEEQFYLVWPVVVLVLRRDSLVKVCLGLMIVALLIRIGLRLSGFVEAAYVLTPARMDALTTGALLALIARRPRGLNPMRRFAMPAALACGLTLVSICVAKDGLHYENFVTGTGGHFYLACFFGSLLVMALTSPVDRGLARWLVSKPLTFLGKYSYCLYVVHHPLFFFVPALVSFTIVPTIWGSQLPARLLYIVLMTLVSIAIAFVSWHIWEKQFLKLKQFFPYRSDDGGFNRPTWGAQQG